MLGYGFVGLVFFLLSGVWGLILSRVGMGRHEKYPALSWIGLAVNWSVFSRVASENNWF